MALGQRRRQQQDTFWVAADKLGRGPRNAFYDRLNQLLDDTSQTSHRSGESLGGATTVDHWREYLRKLYEEETGNRDPDDEELRRFDKRRKAKKKVSNEDWESETDPDSRIGKMKDGRFHLKYKAENAVDLETEIIVAAEIYHGDECAFSCCSQNVGLSNIPNGIGDFVSHLPPMEVTIVKVDPTVNTR